MPVCYDFAFFHLHEEKFFPHLFNPNVNKIPLEWSSRPIKWLEEWGYKKVDVLQKGDLAIYTAYNPNGVLFFKHAGIYAGNNTVISKWGQGAVWHHGMGEITQEYGDHLYFFRRQIKFQSAEKVLNMLVELRSSPLIHETDALFKKFSDDSSQIILQAIQEAMPKSLMGKIAQEKWCALFRDSLRGLDKSGSGLDLISRLESCVITTLDQVEPDLTLLHTN